jgi:hypothetical protein
MIEAGQWGRGDDKRLITSLAATGAAEAFQVDWGSLVPGRTGEQVKQPTDGLLQQQQQQNRHWQQQSQLRGAVTALVQC